MIKEKLAEIVQQAFSAACLDGAMGPLKSSADCSVVVVIEKPKSPEHGDFACGMALKLASQAKFAPLRIAETLSQYIAKSAAYGTYVSKVEVAAPGFINFTLGTAWLTETINQVHNLGPDYGRAADNGKKVLVEYVSANPTGELHIGHGRNAVFGSCLANLMKFGGYNVDQEFYINDYGEQILQLGRCAWALYQRLLGQQVDYPSEGYPEEFLRDFVQSAIDSVGDKYLKASDEEGCSIVGDLVKDLIIDNQRTLLKSLGIEFDLWYSERSLHSGGNVVDVLKEFDKHGFTYEKDGAYWLKAQELGDERDRVLRKSSGATTYLANDAAYHLTKYGRGYDLMINIWGADHHGQVPGLKGAVRALGQDPSKLEVILTQMVNLSRDGQIVKMSKRAGTVIMLSEVVDEVGADATRYYLAESSPQNTINFDLDLAKKTGRENPAFYIQYAHARCCAILRKALEPSIHSDSESGQVEEPPISAQQWQEFLHEYKEDKQGKVFAPLFDTDVVIAGHQKALIARLETFPAEVEEAVHARNPGRIARFAYDLANDLQKFYEVSRVLTDDLSVSKARLGLIFATKQVLSNALGIIGVSAPERM